MNETVPNQSAPEEDKDAFVLRTSSETKKFRTTISILHHETPVKAAIFDVNRRENDLILLAIRLPLAKAVILTIKLCDSEGVVRQVEHSFNPDEEFSRQCRVRDVFSDEPMSVHITCENDAFVIEK